MINLKCYQSLLVISLLIFFGRAADELQCETKLGGFELECHCITGSSSEDDDILSNIKRDFKGSAKLQRVQEITITGCETPQRFTLNYNQLAKPLDPNKDELSNVRKIRFQNSSPLGVYFSGKLHTGDQVVEFRNIKGFDNSAGLLASAVLTGGVDYCANSCETNPPDQTGPPSRWTDCNDCVVSNLRLSFFDVEHVLLKHLAIASYEHLKEEGHATLYAVGVKTFRIDDPFLSRVTVDSIDAEECWLRSKAYRNPYTDVQVDCNSYGDGDGTLGAGYITLIVFGVIFGLLFLFCCFYLCRLGYTSADNSS